MEKKPKHGTGDMLEVKSDDAMRGWGAPCTMRQLGKGGKDGQKEESGQVFTGRSGVLTCVTPLILPLFDHSATDRLGVVGVRLRKGKLCPCPVMVCGKDLGSNKCYLGNS